MGRKHSRSQAQIKQTESLTLHQTKSHWGSNCVALSSARANIRRVNRLLKQAHDDTTQEICNGRKHNESDLRQCDDHRMCSLIFSFQHEMWDQDLPWQSQWVTCLISSLFPDAFIRFLGFLVSPFVFHHTFYLCLQSASIEEFFTMPYFTYESLYTTWPTIWEIQVSSVTRSFRIVCIIHDQRSIFSSIDIRSDICLWIS